MSHDVRLPKAKTPVFPNYCLHCREKVADTTVRVCSGAVGWWNFVFLTGGMRFCVDLPICSGCKRRFRRQRRTRFLLTALLALAGAVVALEILEGYEGPFRLWVGSGIVALVLIPTVFWELFWPPTFDLTPYTRSVDYHFRHRTDGEIFAALNGGKVE
ncbi:MAG: hypothetical protein AAF657_11750 [Acidobacteriota bacterium]